MGEQVSLQRALVGHSACIWDAQFVPQNEINARYDPLPTHDRKPEKGTYTEMGRALIA